MSTTTNFKRIALVAVASLGLGVLSSVPSQALISSSSITLTTTAGTAVNNPATALQQDTSTGALVTVQFLASNANTDSVTLTISAKSKPNSSVSYPKALLTLVDTASGSTANTTVRLDTRVAAAGAQTSNPQASELVAKNTIQSFNPVVAATGPDSGTAALISTPTDNTYAYASFRLHMDTATTRAAGSYVFTVTASPFEHVAGGATPSATAASVKTIDVTIVVGSAGSTTAATSYSSASLTEGSTFAGITGGVDSTVAVSSKASTTARAVVRVALRTATNTTTATESITVSMNVGSSGITAGTPIGKNVTYAYTETARTAGYLDILLFSDGTAGTATINISTTSVTFAAKTVNFYSTTATKLTVVSATTVLGTGTNTATGGAAGTAGVIWVKATDANGATVIADADGTSGVFAYSSNKSVVTDSGTACAYNSALGYHTCSLTGGIAGSATITIANSSSNEPLATVKGDKSVAVTVTTAAPASLKLAFNKASYAPGEKGYILISALDSTGKALPGAQRTNLMATGGISLSGSFSGTLPTLTDVTYTTAARVAGVDGIDSTDAVAMLTFYAPYSGTSMTISATGGSLLPAAGQVKVTATASVADSGAAALAAVNALATTVASLKTLITTLTNLVLKIQKKVKA